MELRQHSGEIAPATWLGGAVTAVTLGGVVLLAERWVGSSPAFIVFWCGCAVAALCLFGAGRQHFINVGRERERIGREDAKVVEAGQRESAGLAAPILPPNIKLVDLRTVQVKVGLDGHVWEVHHHIGGDDRGFRFGFAAVAVFMNEPRHGYEGKIGQTKDAIAQIDLTHGGQTVRVTNGFWLGGVQPADFPVGLSQELVIAAGVGNTGFYTVDFRPSGPPFFKKLDDGKYAVSIRLFDASFSQKYNVVIEVNGQEIAGRF